MRGGVLRRDVVLGASFVLLWVIPMAHTAVAGYPTRLLQANLRDFYSVTCLFGERATERVVFYAQVRHAGRDGWYDLDEAEYFPMQPFGHRSRFDRFMARFGHRRDADAARIDLAHWLAARHAVLHPDAEPIVAVRYVWAGQSIVDGPPPDGHWKKPAPAAMRTQFRVLGAYPLSDGGGP